MEDATRHTTDRAASARDAHTGSEHVIATIAVRQHGVVTRSQLLRAGVSPDVVDRRATTGRLRRIHQGVYLVGPIAAARSREMAAVLAYGAGAVLSHWSAAVCWQILPAREQASVDVLVAGRRLASRPGLCIHLVRTLCADEITTHDNIPITTPARTLYDLAGCAELRELERALAEALALRLTSTSDIATLLNRYRGASRCETSAESAGTRLTARAHALAGRGAISHADPEGPIARSRAQCQARRLRGRLPLAHRTAGGRDRRTGVPLIGSHLRKRSPPRWGAPGRGRARDACDLAPDRK